MERVTKKQKRYLVKWTVIVGIICGTISAIILFIFGGTNWKEPAFWWQTIVMAMGGGIVLGLIPAVLVDYRRTSNE